MGNLVVKGVENNTIKKDKELEKPIQGPNSDSSGIGFSSIDQNWDKQSISNFTEYNKKILSIFQTLDRNIENQGTELNYINEYTFCIAVMLSAQTKDTSVNKVTDILFKVADNPSAMLALSEEGLIEIIRSIGLHNNKAKNIMAFSKIIMEEFGGNIPDKRDVLERLPGIGRKSANVIVNTLFHGAVIAVDTHVLRVSKRLGLTEATSPLAVETDLIKKVPSQYHINASNLLVLHGRYVCTAKNPKCKECVIRAYCPNGKSVQIN